MVVPVAVEVMFWFAPTLFSGLKVKATLPSALVVTLLAPMYFLPSLPEGFEKKRILKVLFGTLFRDPFTVVSPPTFSAEVRFGLFWRLLGPSSGSSSSLGVAPSIVSTKSIPSPPFENIELRRMPLPKLVSGLR